MKTSTLLTIMNVLAWITFGGLMIKGGAMLFSYVITIFKPEASHNFYSGLDLYVLRESGMLHYSVVVFLMVALVCLKAYTVYLVIQILSKLKLSAPFKAEIAGLMEKVSHYIVEIWLLIIVSNAYYAWLESSKFKLSLGAENAEFIFLAGIIYIFAQVYKRGVEIQSDNELTV